MLKIKPKSIVHFRLVSRYQYLQIGEQTKNDIVLPMFQTLNGLTFESINTNINQSVKSLRYVDTTRHYTSVHAFK